MANRKLMHEKFEKFLLEAIKQTRNLKRKIKRKPEKTRKKEIEKKSIEKPKLIMRQFAMPETKLFRPLPEFAQQVGKAEVKLLTSLKEFKPSIKQEQFKEGVKEEKKFDFGKLNEIVYKPEVAAIECNGPNTEIIAKTRDEKIIKTNIKLTKDEIMELIAKISANTKVPITRLFQAIFNEFSITAIIDDEPKFVIAKLK